MRVKCKITCDAPRVRVADVLDKAEWGEDDQHLFLQVSESDGVWMSGMWFRGWLRAGMW